MNLKRFLLLSFATYGLCALWAITGVQGDSETIYAPSVPATVTLGMLTPEQLVDQRHGIGRAFSRYYPARWRTS